MAAVTEIFEARHSLTPSCAASRLVWAQIAATPPSISRSRIRPVGVPSVIWRAGWKITGWWATIS